MDLSIKTSVLVGHDSSSSIYQLCGVSDGASSFWCKIDLGHAKSNRGLQDQMTRYVSLDADGKEQPKPLILFYL